ncbi:MAG TPA: hypothetical protein VJP58_01155 [Candidatus Nitrosocosmicus sp.]|nr:hypothetical protein [Candidatus Nitrosocosmicus sp.]
MQKILILAEDPIRTKLEEKLRRRFDVETAPIPLNGICEIKLRLRGNWITLCRFSQTENFRDIITMFNVNYDLKSRTTTSVS